MNYYGATAPQLPDADLMGMIQQAADKLMRQNNEHPQIANIVLQEIIREVPRIQSELRYNQAPDGTIRYSDIEQKVGQYLGIMIPQIRQRMMPPPQMGMPMYPQQQGMMMQPQMPQQMFGPQQMMPQQQPYGMQDPYRSTIQQPHQTNVLPTTHAAKLINDAHNRVQQQNNSIFNQAPPPVSTYNNTQSATQVVPNLFPNKDEQPKQEIKNAPVSKMTTKLFPMQLIKEITTGEHNEDITDKVITVNSVADIPKLSKHLGSFEAKLSVCGKTNILVGRGEYVYPCINNIDAFHTLNKILPQAFSNKQDYFIEITYPELRAKYLGGMEITDETIKKIHTLFDSLADLRDELDNDDVMSAMTLDEGLAKIMAPDNIDYPINQYITQYIISECLKRTRFTLVEHNSPCEITTYESLQDLGSLQNFYRSIHVSQQLKTKWKQYEDIIHTSVHNALVSTLNGLTYVPTNNYDNLQLPGEYDFHWSTYTKHPGVAAIALDNTPLDDNQTDETQLEEIKNNLNKYFFHLVPKTVLFTNSKDHGLETNYMGNIINTPRTYAQQFINNSLSELLYKGDLLDYCIIDDFGNIKYQYTINRMLSSAMLCLKHVTF